jgi:hypothetical protein
MIASTVTWIYADRIKADPERRHIAKGRTSFLLSLMFVGSSPILLYQMIFLGFGRVGTKSPKILLFLFCYGWWLETWRRQLF